MYEQDYLDCILLKKDELNDMFAHDEGYWMDNRDRVK